MLNLLQVVSPESLESLASTLQPGESAWVSGALSDSYENEIFSSLGVATSAQSLEEYRKIFWKLGLEIEQLEIQREMLFFSGEEELRAWLKAQVKNEVQADWCLEAMKQKGWIKSEGRIGFPTKHLVACLKAH